MPTIKEAIQACNIVSRRNGSGPILPDEPTLMQIREWLVWNDNDGDYDWLDKASVPEAHACLLASWSEGAIEWWIAGE